MTGPTAKVIADSISPVGDRLTTLEVTMHRFVLAEFNTHRVFCLAGDAQLEFDLPGGRRGHRKVHRMRIDEFVDKWHHGARRVGANPRRPANLDAIEPDRVYSGPEAAALIGHGTASNLHTACRSGALSAYREGRVWRILGADLRRWRETLPEHTRYDMRDRLRGMRIRQLDERTGLVLTSTVEDCCVSGVKPVYVVDTGRDQVAGSADHLIFTPSGYRRIGDLRPGDEIVVRRFGKRPEDMLDDLRLKKIGGEWRSVWQRKKRAELLAVHGGCQKCGGDDRLQIHHIVPVYVAPELAFADDNVMLICEPCHNAEHCEQDWQGGTYLYGDTVAIRSITFRGIEDTYDLQIAGEFPNFIAGGIVVHNSRNSASSRAIPASKQIDRVQHDPAIPIEWGSNQPGMQAGAQLDDRAVAKAKREWLIARDVAVATARNLAELGVHKQVTNRLLEPFMWHTVICSATDWDGFWVQRCSPLAQPEIRAAAEAMRAAYDASEPVQRPWPLWTSYDGQGDCWHLPYVTGIERETLPISMTKQLSVARCARVSYMTHDGRYDPSADVALYERLITARPMHASPLEHVACPVEGDSPGNFTGWRQLRHIVEQGGAA